MKSDRSNGLLTIQALRAVAALLVVVYHALDAWAVHRAGKDADAIWGNGAAGVDLFFVISGLVMTLSAERIAHLPHPARLFLRQRATRIFPLYWLVTTAKVVLVAMLPALASRTTLVDPFYVVGSYLLLPVHDLTGQIRPILPVGWTLIYEALFYVLVAGALAMRVRPMLGAAIALVVLAVAGLGRNDISSVLLLEFLLGIGVGHLSKIQRPMPIAVALGMIAVGFVMLLTVRLPTADLRPLLWGVPAAMIVMGAVWADPRYHNKLPGWVLLSGDASYALYLTHGFVIPAVWIIVNRAVDNSIIAAVISIPASTVVSLLVGWLVHLWVERPMLRWSRRRAAWKIAPAG